MSRVAPAANPGPGAVAALVGFLAVYNNVLNVFRPSTAPYVLVNSCTAAGLLAAGRKMGLQPAAMGLGRRQLRGAVRWSALSVAVIGAVLGLIGLHPAGRRLLDDRRASQVGPEQLARWVGLRIPLGTVLLEEVAFRGVLYGVFEQRWSPAGAAAGSSAVFGVWHVLPALQTLEVNVPGAGPGTKLAAAAAGAVATTAVGVALCGLRRLSGGILAPGAAHLTANTLFAVAATRHQWRSQTGARRRW